MQQKAHVAVSIDETAIPAKITTILVFSSTSGAYFITYLLESI